ncbi:hypothetical protein O181_091674 [Austropuccinia psidii MF-1]|uniref:Uncharacterized protein n=1 Tax=Austropuccinia psidii MF-1 TaxID=1389203 RepID=A0A9Q3P852_9BASI|nr:hypothetical protein [Austropuccinia psidii MF-1]
MDVTLELDTRYHERKREKNHFQENKTEASKSSSIHQNYSSSRQKKKENFNVQKRDKPHASLLNKYFNFMCSEKEKRLKEGLCTYCGGKHNHEACFKKPQNQLTQPSGKSLSEDPVVFDGINYFPPRAQLCILNTGFKKSLKFFVSSSLSDTVYSILIYWKEACSQYPSSFVTHHTEYMVEPPSFQIFEWDFLVIGTPKGEDLILGFDFLNHFNTSIDWRKWQITFNTDYKDSSDSFVPLSNDLSSSKTCAELVGDSRTP